jgi:hypothetical protein
MRSPNRLLALIVAAACSPPGPEHSSGSLQQARDGKLSFDFGFQKLPQSYLIPTTPGVVVKALFTAGDTVDGEPGGPPYRMAGVPDGLGAFDNGDGTFTLLSNHGIPPAGGIVRAHGSQGAFVSRWTVRKSDLSFVAGKDLIRDVLLFSPGAGAYVTTVAPVSFSRFRPADLAPVSALFDAATGLGYEGQLFLAGEASPDGRAWAHGLDGTSMELSRLGTGSWGSIRAQPKPPAGTTIVAGTLGSQVVCYVGAKGTAGTRADKAGLAQGRLHALAVAGVPDEPAAGFPAGTAFTLAGAAAGTRFNHPGGGAWNPGHPGDFYFVTTASFMEPSRLWRARFTDLGNLAAGGTLDLLLDGSEGQRMLGSLTVTATGKIYLQESAGDQDHIGKIWRYDIAAGKPSLTMILQHNPIYFAPGAARFLTRNEESSGVLDASAILGPGWLLMAVQAHFRADTELFEGGQLLAVFDPAAK